MIVLLLLNLIYNLFAFFISGINVAVLPPDANVVINSFLDYLVMGYRIISTYTNLPYILTLFSIVIYIDFAMAIFHFVMFILRKIPLLNIH